MLNFTAIFALCSVLKGLIPSLVTRFRTTYSCSNDSNDNANVQNLVQFHGKFPIMMLQQHRLVSISRGYKINVSLKRVKLVYSGKQLYYYTNNNLSGLSNRFHTFLNYSSFLVFLFASIHTEWRISDFAPNTRKNHF